MIKAKWSQNWQFWLRRGLIYTNRIQCVDFWQFLSKIAYFEIAYLFHFSVGNLCVINMFDLEPLCKWFKKCQKILNVAVLGIVLFHFPCWVIAGKYFCGKQPEVKASFCLSSNSSVVKMNGESSQYYIYIFFLNIFPFWHFGRPSQF